MNRKKYISILAAALLVMSMTAASCEPPETLEVFVDNGVVDNGIVEDNPMPPPKYPPYTVIAFGDCRHVEWLVANYDPDTPDEYNRLTFYLDGEPMAYSEFDEGTSDTWPLGWAVDHTWRVVVDAPGTAHDYDTGDQFTVACPCG